RKLSAIARIDVLLNVLFIVLTIDFVVCANTFVMHQSNQQSSIYGCRACPRFCSVSWVVHRPIPSWVVPDLKENAKPIDEMIITANPTIAYVKADWTVGELICKPSPKTCPTMDSALSSRRPNFQL